ncbi:MAG: right-handed parallel beta-helix repeat-containing protein [Pseudomonadales bacterium]|nr:right-handed parallel beta-helix repeat-containing protein [Pseudomonadales bacterium]
MTKTLKRLFPVALLVLAGCAVSTDDGVFTRPAIGTGTPTETSREERDLPTTVAILPFTNSTDSEFAYEVVRRTMANHFATKNYRWVHWRDVDNRLALAGLDTPQKVMAADRAELAQLLGVDGLIYGNITHYDKTFAGIYAQISVGVELSFVKPDGSIIWSVTDVRRSHAGGVSTSPVGLLINALISAKHLYGDLNLYRAADDLGRDLASKLPEPAVLAQSEKPAITDVIHSGVGQYLHYGDKLEVAIQGDPGMTAVASIDGLGLVDLTESSPGEYVGSINIDRNTNVKDAVVTGRLQNSTGQTTSWISPYGLLNIDNTPPAAVTNVTTESRDGAVRLAWQSSDDDIAGYAIGVAPNETAMPTRTYQSANASFTLTGLDNFAPVYLSITATDHAGNVGSATRVTAIAAPDARYGMATALPANLPAVISGIQKATALGGPYFLGVDSRIGSDGVLLVEPGTRFVVSPGAQLTVQGELHMFGTKSNPVVATAASGQTFDEFLLIESTKPVTIAGLSVEGAGIPVQISAGAPLIENSSFKDSQFNAMSIGGAARPVIRGNLFEGARTSGIIIQGQSQPTFEGNQFINNEPFHLQNGSTYQVNLKNNTFRPAASNTTILGDAVY